MTLNAKTKLLLMPMAGIGIATCLLLNIFSHSEASEIRETASLTKQEHPQLDPLAWQMLNQTRFTRYYFTENFAGFTCDLLINDNGKIATGTVDYELAKGAIIQAKGLSEDELWPTEMLTNMIGHRRQLSFAKGDGRNPITFGPEDNSPLGRLVLLNDKRSSSYRILNGRVSEVKRTEGNQYFTITIMDEFDTGRGKYLPRHFTVSYFDAMTKSLVRTDSFTDRYTQIGKFWFPKSRRVFRAEGDQVITRILDFQNPKIRFKSE